MVNNGFLKACQDGGLDFVKLYTSGELKKHANIDEGFKIAFNSKNIEVIRYFIFDMNIERTESINTHINNNIALSNIPGLKLDSIDDIVQDMFNKREISYELNEELIPVSNVNIKVKKNKI